MVLKPILQHIKINKNGINRNDFSILNITNHLIHYSTAHLLILAGFLKRILFSIQECQCIRSVEGAVMLSFCVWVASNNPEWMCKRLMTAGRLGLTAASAVYAVMYIQCAALRLNYWHPSTEIQHQTTGGADPTCLRAASLWLMPS